MEIELIDLDGLLFLAPDPKIFNHFQSLPSSFDVCIACFLGRGNLGLGKATYGFPLIPNAPPSLWSVLHRIAQNHFYRSKICEYSVDLNIGHSKSGII